MNETALEQGKFKEKMWNVVGRILGERIEPYL